MTSVEMKNRAKYFLGFAIAIVFYFTATIELDPRHALAYANRGVVKMLLKQRRDGGF